MKNENVLANSGRWQLFLADIVMHILFGCSSVEIFHDLWNILSSNWYLLFITLLNYDMRNEYISNIIYYGLLKLDDVK